MGCPGPLALTGGVGGPWAGAPALNRSTKALCVFDPDQSFFDGFVTRDPQNPPIKCLGISIGPHDQIVGIKAQEIRAANLVPNCSDVSVGFSNRTFAGNGDWLFPIRSRSRQQKWLFFKSGKRICHGLIPFCCLSSRPKSVQIVWPNGSVPGSNLIQSMIW